ncbi:bifunctional folylpolyglutamate synthase/dihydrofolate synthase [Peptoniphilus indolicus]|nr:folylpolyglutamate synthase/dihydrofolate synthase family protein [Peptoniphilus indolicus]SUB75049.1 Folylpolyglutamate synthase [Peptoniphilus indolicus]
MNTENKQLKTFDDYVDWMYDRGSSGEKHTMENVGRLLAAFDNPQDKIKAIHVAGTNGKGSTCHYLESALSATSKCGLFISPYMETILESISINGVQISDKDFMKYIDELKPVVETLDAEGFHNTYFEVLTAIMYRYFYDQKVDVAVIEVGLGGRVDSTNIIKAPLASVIVTISMDHVNILGNTIEEIAENKGGIIKDNRPVFVYPQKPEVMSVLREIASEHNSEFFTFSPDEIKDIELSPENNQFSFRNFTNAKTKLVGVHQLYNVSLALMVLERFKDEFNLTDDIIKESIFNTENHGRLEVISENPKVLIDGSHNAEAIEALLESLKAFKYNRLIVGFSILKDKDYNYVISKLSSIADELIITNIDNPRAFELEDLKKEVLKKTENVTAIADRIEAYEYSKSRAKDGDLVLWCGSLYLIREFRLYEKNKK